MEFVFQGYLFLDYGWYLKGFDDCFNECVEGLMMQIMNISVEYFSISTMYNHPDVNLCPCLPCIETISGQIIIFHQPRFP